CEVSFREASGLVSGVACPPAAGTLKRPAKVVAVPNTIVPSRFHVPLPTGPSHTVCTGPPEASIVLSLPSWTNATARLSGDQNGTAGTSVPASGCASSVSSDRIHRTRRLLDPNATNTMRRPSGDTTGVVVPLVAARVDFGAAATLNRIGAASLGAVRR